ncbi:MAG: nucleoside:proton symporter [Deltaproteobacteria bacterium]|nr:MAG: nucleoside:proton symporter [Deltaproteobacteria bacterium]
MQAWLGLFVLTLIAYLLSEDRRNIVWRPVVTGLVLQFVIAVALLRVPLIKQPFLMLNDLALALERATRAGTAVVFGFLGGGALPFVETSPGASYVLAFRALPLVLVVSALSAVLFHLGILQRLVALMALVLQRTMGIGGAVGISAAANIFVGMVEAPLLVRPYLARLSRGELFMVMTCGMSTIAGTVLVLYAGILGAVLPDALGHILVASIISAPAGLAIAQLMVPAGSDGAGERVVVQRQDSSVMDAVTRGTAEGLSLLLNIVAMLVVLIALVSLVNQGLGLLPDFSGAPLSLERMLGWLLAPVAWLIGIPWDQAPLAGSLIGTKTVLNEFVAYLQLAGTSDAMISPHSRLILTYALCGFANFGSLGIMIGGLRVMVPERQSEVVSLGLRSIVSGTLATLMTGAVVGLVV